MKAVLRNYKQAPRKVRLVTSYIKGRRAEDALAELSFLPQKSAQVIRKLLVSAVSNAVNTTGARREHLYIKDAVADEGITLKRFMPVWRNIAHPINRRRSHIRIVLEEKAPQQGELKEQEKLENKESN